MGLLVVGSVRWDRLKLGLDTLPLIELVDLDNFEMRQSEDYFLVFQKSPETISADRSTSRRKKNLSWDINSYWQVVVLLAAAVAAIVVFEAVDAATVFDAVVVVVVAIVVVAGAIAVAGVAELVENAMRLVLVEIASMTSLIDQVDDELALAV